MLMLTKDQCVVNDSPWAEQSQWENWERVANRAAICARAYASPENNSLIADVLNLVC